MNMHRTIKLFRFGPGTAITLIGLIAVLIWQVFLPQKVKVERQIVSEPSIANSAAPSVSNLLTWKEELAITKEQLIGLQRLQADEKNKLAPLEKEIDHFYGEFNSLVEKHKDHPVSLNAIKEASRIVSALSFKKRQIINEYSEAGLAILSPEQTSLANSMAKRTKHLIGRRQK
jgi:hypothetical protein